jgi:protein-tyrosine-phosphatase/DNA-binding transcriptional ArsR family regulator
VDLDGRAKIHAALGDPERLRIIDDLSFSDRSVNELANLVQMPGNLLAHHLDVLERAGLIRRQVSEGDRRRRYVTLERDLLAWLGAGDPTPISDVLFVCTHNSARSQFAAALWHRLSDRPVHSAGSEPARSVHPLAVQVGAEFGVDLSRAAPSGYESVGRSTDLLVSVCDRAREAALPQARRHLHWSVPDPVPRRTVSSFRSAFADISQRVRLLAASAG